MNSERRAIVNVAALILGIVLIITIVNAIPLVSFDSSTPANNTYIRATSAVLNLSIVEPSLGSLTYNWNGTNYTMYNDSLILSVNFNNLTTLGDNSSKVVDISKYNNNGTILNGAAYNLSGKYGSSIDLDGVNDYVNFSNSQSLQITGPVSLSAWVYPRSTAGDILIASKIYYISGTDCGGYSLRKNTAGYEFNIANNAWGWTYTANAVILNQWQHLVGVYDGSATLKLYLNGVLLTPTSTAAAPSSIKNINQPFGIGYVEGSSFWTSYFNGSIDEVQVWNRSLSSQEIYQLYISNLQKINQTQWYLYVNQSQNLTNGLSDGTYTTQLFATNSSGSINSTDFRTLNIQSAIPQLSVNWISPTTNITTNQTGLFNISVNVSCLNGNCGVINVTLDPSGTIYNFSTCGISGPNGPTQANCNTTYNGTNLQGLVGVSSGIQNWTVPTTGTYTIDSCGASGARGGYAANTGGYGACITGTFQLSAGTVLKIMVGQNGSFDGTYGGGGGGGTFVVKATNNDPLVIAGGGGGAAISNITSIYESCSKNSDCPANNYCFDNKCHLGECTSNSDCSDGKACWDLRCVKLFDIKILDIDSHIGPGNFISFSYFLKGMAKINNDIVIDFWIEKDGKKITFGKDTIYMGDFEEKTEKAKIFIPSDTPPGKYNFYISVSYEKYSAQSQRQIEIDQEGNVLLSLRGALYYILPLLLLIIILLIVIILRIERKKIDNLFIYEEEWILTHKLSLSILYLSLASFGAILIFGFIGYVNLPLISDYRLDVQSFTDYFIIPYISLIMLVSIIIFGLSLILRHRRKIYKENYGEPGKGFVTRRKNYLEHGLKKIQNKLHRRRIERNLNKKVNALEKKGYDINLIKRRENMRAELANWKNKGYDTDSIKNLSNKAEKDKLKEWKKKGFDVGSIGG